MGPPPLLCAFSYMLFSTAALVLLMIYRRSEVVVQKKTASGNYKYVAVAQSAERGGKGEIVTS